MLLVVVVTTSVVAVVVVVVVLGALVVVDSVDEIDVMLDVVLGVPSQNYLCEISS